MGTVHEPAGGAGPLVVSAANPRYFTVHGRRAVYLTGSHIWNNLHDGMGPGAACAETAERLDYDAYLDFLEAHGHNFIRLWRWEQFRSQAAGGDFHLCMTPQPWPRTGPSAAKDGRPRFDLDRFDQAFFDRLRGRVVAAGERGMYVAVMLFEGWGLHLSPPPDHVEGHPFHAANNVNGVGIGSIVDYQVLPLDPRVQALQEAYIRKVVDTVGDLPNLLWEVAAELGSDRHPIGMTMQFPVAEQTRVNDPLFASRAEWISPGYDDKVFAGGRHPMAPGAPQSRWLEDPPALWAWKSFLRGHHPILMDMGLIGGVAPPDPSAGGPMSYAAFESARHAMGDTLRFAGRMRLIAMAPRGDLSSTGYALAEPGEEYLVLEPGGAAGPFRVRLEPGAYAAEWFSVEDRQTVQAATTTVERSGAVSFSAPSEVSGPSVLYLKKVSGR